MTSSAQALPLRRPALGPSGPWIQSPGFDLSFFILSPLLTLPLVVGILAGFTRLNYLGFLLAFAHYLSTFAFFFWDENRAEHRARWVAFFAGPLIITAAFWSLVAFQVPLVIPFVLFFWNTLHVAFQSCGILSLYRHRAGIVDPHQKSLANHAIIAVSVWLALWNIDTHKEVWPILNWVAPSFPQVVRTGAALGALVCLARLTLGLRRRSREGLAPGPLEIGILLTGLLLFHPYLWMRDSESATFVMLLPHYLQYLGLVWLLHRRKFTTPQGSSGQRWLTVVSHNNVLLAGVLLSGGMAFLAGKILFRSIGHVEQFEAIYLLLAFVHFYLDGLFWAFRDPHVRRTVGPYLASAPMRRLAPAASAG